MSSTIADRRRSRNTDLGADLEHRPPVRPGRDLGFLGDALTRGRSDDADMAHGVMQAVLEGRGVVGDKPGGPLLVAGGLQPDPETEVGTLANAADAKPDRSVLTGAVDS